MNSVTCFSLKMKPKFIGIPLLKTARGKDNFQGEQKGKPAHHPLLLFLRETEI